MCAATPARRCLPVASRLVQCESSTLPPQHCSQNTSQCREACTTLSLVVNSHPLLQPLLLVLLVLTLGRVTSASFPGSHFYFRGLGTRLACTVVESNHLSLMSNHAGAMAAIIVVTVSYHLSSPQAASRCGHRPCVLPHGSPTLQFLLLRLPCHVRL